LLHPTSLPSPFGIGDLGTGAYASLDFLQAAGQSLWQVLPLTPTGFGNSPYAAPSAFAGNPLLIALQPLIDRGWLGEEHALPLRKLSRQRVDFAQVVPLKHAALEAAHLGFRERAAGAERHAFVEFRDREVSWLDDFALFTALRERLGTIWTDWDPPLRDRDPEALDQARRTYAEVIERHAFSQYVFFEQWEDIRTGARERGIRLIGDLPIFVAHDSVDVWAHRTLFKLEPDGSPRLVAGVPPDYFSATGQLWGNPLYDWEVVARDGFGWWIERFRRLLQRVDLVRIDHFRGFDAAWEVPANAASAVEGRWEPGPGEEVFRAIDAALGGTVPVIAEDLGMITEDVRALLRATGYPGMKVLQFAFGGDAHNPYLPHRYRDPNCVVYTGTHDNDTTRGWFATASEHEQERVREYLGRDGSDIAWDFIRAALASVADTAIVPLQDVLDLGSEGRMNQPGAALGNWEWRVLAEELSDARAARLRALTELYGRLPESGD
jgi:4-alpha-glucanotransferase